MTKVIITGAAGFIGSAVARECLKHNIFVYAIDHNEFPKDRLPADNKNLVYIKTDVYEIAILRRLLLDNQYDIFYQFAWVGSAGNLRADYDCQVNNALKTVELLKLAKELGCKKFISAGSIMEFESFEAIYTQGNQPSKSYIYGIGKQLAHSLCKPIANELDIELVWTYITNAYGAGELSPRLINTTIRKCINNEELNFTAGAQNYDFIYIDDVAKAFYLLGQFGKANKNYLIGSGQARPLRAFLEELVTICSNSLTPNFGDIPYTGTNLSLDTFSIRELQEDCGFIPEISFNEGIKKTYNWLKEQNNAKV